MVEDGYEFFAKRQLVTLFSAPNYCGEFDNAGSMMTVDETLMCSFQVGDRRFIPASNIAELMPLQILKPADKKKFPYGGGVGSNRPVTPPRNGSAREQQEGEEVTRPLTTLHYCVCFDARRTRARAYHLRVGMTGTGLAAHCESLSCTCCCSLASLLVSR